MNFNSASGPSSIKGLRVRYSGAGFSPGINFSSATTTAREVRTDSCQHDGIRLIALQGVARDFTTFAYSDAGIRILNNATAIQNATIVNTNGTGIFNSGGFTGSITNTILWGNTAEFSGVTSPMVSWSDTSTYAGSNNNVNANPAFVNQAAGDLRLTAASPCIDAGDPTFGAASGDAGGAPRLTDGNLDGARRIDIGAHEFTNVGLAISGVAQPGGTLTISTTGTAGLPVLFLAGLDGEQEVTPYGTLFVNLALPHLLIAYGTVPSTIPALVPANFPVPFDLAFQEIVAQGSKANFSNVVHLHFTQP